MRARALTLVVVLATGCATLSGSGPARRQAVARALAEERFALSQGEAVARIQQRTRLRPACSLAPGGYHCTECIDGACYEVVDEDGLTRVVFDRPLQERDTIALWRALDVASYERASGEFETRTQLALLEQEKEVPGRWGLTGGVVSTVSLERSAPAFGGRVGVRRWFDVHLGALAAVQYTFTGEHELHLRVGVEINRWTDDRFWSPLGVPAASVLLFSGPVLRLPSGLGGIRTGVCLLLTQLRAPPLFVELAADTRLAGDDSRVVGIASVGIGI